MKKIIIITLTFIIALLSVNCKKNNNNNNNTNNNSTNNNNTNNNNNTEEKMYTITFIDKYGEVIEIKQVKEKEDLSSYQAPNVLYHTFSSWSQDLSNINSNLEVQAMYTENNEKYNIDDYNYWLQKLSKTRNISKTILTKEQIDSYNQNIRNGKSYTKVTDVLSLNSSVNPAYIKLLIENYSNINKRTAYNYETNEVLSSAEIDEILNNRNISELQGNNEIKASYGIVTNFVWMRSYPTKHYSSTYERDYFQETSLNVGEPVLIYHTSADGNWYFVQATNYYGWVEKDNIAICEYDELNEFINCENRLVVISDYVIIEESHVRMGQFFPLTNETNNSYLIKFPVRKEDGNLELKTIELEKSDDYSVGYLDYTYENLYKQAFKLLDIDYSWGDKEKLGRDCSSTQNAIYASFGFIMPRNTSNQNAIPTYGKSFKSISIEILKDNYLPGTLIFSSGHVMMYIGENENGESYILHNTSAGEGKCILQKIEDYGINKIIGTLKLQ